MLRGKHGNRGIRKLWGRDHGRAFLAGAGSWLGGGCGWVVFCGGAPCGGLGSAGAWLGLQLGRVLGRGSYVGGVVLGGAPCGGWGSGRGGPSLPELSL